MKKVFFYCLSFLLVLLMIFYFYQPRIVFTHKEIHLGLYEEVKPNDYIEKYHRIDPQSMTITNHVNNQKIGVYTIDYHYQEKTFSLQVYIDDRIPPQFETINIKILRNEMIEASSLVKNIQDDSKTIVYFKEDYLFNEVKTYRVSVVVEDEYENRTEKSAYVLVEAKDSEAPSLSGLTPLRMHIGDQIDFKKNVIVKDDHDKNPKLTIDQSELDIYKKGNYKIYYHCIDKSGNESIYTRDIQVCSPYDNRDSINDGDKVCYLTFDDGPSSNTKDILKILDDYHIKATFFVTATSLDHLHYIKEAYQKGHTIGLHTYSHDYEYIYSSQKNYFQDLNKIREVVHRQTGVYTPYIRFPGGSSNKVSRKYNIGIMKRLTHKVIDLGYQYYDWTSINGDGEGMKTISGLKKKAFEEMEGYEDIMFLMHDSATCTNTVKTLPAIIDELIRRGYRFEAIDKYSPTFHHTIHN